MFIIIFSSCSLLSCFQGLPTSRFWQHSTGPFDESAYRFPALRICRTSRDPFNLAAHRLPASRYSRHTTGPFIQSVQGLPTLRHGQTSRSPLDLPAFKVSLRHAIHRPCLAVRILRLPTLYYTTALTTPNDFNTHQRPLNKADALHRLLLNVRKSCFLHCQWLNELGAFALFCCSALIISFFLIDTKNINPIASHNI